MQSLVTGGTRPNRHNETVHLVYLEDSIQKFRRFESQLLVIALQHPLH